MPELSDVIGIWSRRLPLTSQEASLFASHFKGKGFWMSGVWNDAFVADIQESIAEAITSGWTAGDWFPRAEQILKRYGGKVGLRSGDEWSASYADLVFRNATQSAFAAGRYAFDFSQEGLDEAPFWQYHAIDDRRTRPEHWALNGRIFAKDDEAARHYLPPWDHNCRCTTSNVSSAAMKDEGRRASRGNVIKFRPAGDWDVDRVQSLVPEWFMRRRAA